MPPTIEEELKEAIDRILRSPSRRKLVVAGPGTGKTTLFRLLLEAAPGTPPTRLVLTFINNLKADLDRDLGTLARVATLHGYCQSLLRRSGSLRDGLSADFRCQPGLASLIRDDWEYLRGGEAPHFVDAMRRLDLDEPSFDFYRSRSNYYDAVEFDDSVYRTHRGLSRDASDLPAYDLVLIDEYQDFNRMEAALIEDLAQQSSIVVAGDDDQALYSQLRASTTEHIRGLYSGGAYEVFELPFCMRCPEVIVGAVNDVVERATALRRLEGRIPKPYRHYEPVKGADSRRYPSISLVSTTVQRKNANYFGRFIQRSIQAIPPEEVEASAEKGEPAALIIGPRQYLRQIHEHLAAASIVVESPRDQSPDYTREDGLRILADTAGDNLGWRIILDFEDVRFAARIICQSEASGTPLVTEIPEDRRGAILAEAAAWKAAQATAQPAPPAAPPAGPRVKMTSYEGAKGLSAQHTFIVGLHNGDLPRNPQGIEDIEICRFLVGMTRTKKKCFIFVTDRFAGEKTKKRPSVFLTWINKERFDVVRIDAAYWK